jgi:hypothetical protein
VAVIAEKSVAMKQASGFSASVGTVVSIYVDKSPCLGCGTTSSVKKGLKGVFNFVAYMFSGLII